MEYRVLRLASSGRAASRTHEMWCISNLAVVSAVNRTQEDLPMEKTPFKTKGFKIGSRGRTRRLFPIYFEEKFSISTFRIKLIRQNPYLLRHYSFTTFTTRFTTHFQIEEADDLARINWP
jgi:hypothetical protein